MKRVLGLPGTYALIASGLGTALVIMGGWWGSDPSSRAPVMTVVLVIGVAGGIG
jgi:hypothetical protein